MADSSNATTPSPPRARRPSLVELFTPRAGSNAPTPSSPPSSGVQSLPTGQRRSMSITTLGLSGSSPTQSSPFTAFAKQRQASMSNSSGSGSPEFRNSFGDEPAILEDDDSTGVPLNTPASPSFARRASFGAQALRDVRQASNAGGGRRPSTSLFTLNENSVPENAASPRTAQTTGEGFNWSEALRDRTKRSPSFSSSVNPFAANAARTRPVSGPVTQPPKEMPKPAAPPPMIMKKPDHLGERMLRGDFMMD